MTQTSSQALSDNERASGGRKGKTRSALLQAGAHLMACRSADAVSVDEIVDYAKVAKGTFYYHFTDKDALQRAVLEVIRSDITQEVDQLNAGVTDAARIVARAFCFVLNYASNYPERGNFLIRTFLAFSLSGGRANEGLVKDISIGVQAGRFRIPTAESGALMMLGITQAALVQILGVRGAFSSVARAQQLCAMLLRGLGLNHVESELVAAQETENIICSRSNGVASVTSHNQEADDPPSD